MDAMRNVFGNMSNGVIRLIVTVGVLAAAYFFIVRPVLDTTNNAIDRGFNTANRSLNSIPNQAEINNLTNNALQNTNQALQQGGAGAQLQRQANQVQFQVHRITKKGDINDIQRMSHCLQVAGPNLKQAVTCLRKIH